MDLKIIFAWQVYLLSRLYPHPFIFQTKLALLAQTCEARENSNLGVND